MLANTLWQIGPRAQSLNRQKSLLLKTIAVLLVVAMMLPFLHLMLRALGSDASTWEAYLRFRTFSTLISTISLAASVTLFGIALAVPSAWLVCRTDLPGRRIWAILLALPLAIPSYIAGFAFIAALGPRGFLHQALANLPVTISFPGITGFSGALFALTMITYPYIFLTTAAALQRLDPSFEDSARVLGLGSMKSFLFVTLPLLRPAITAGALLSSLYALSDFGAVALMRFETFTQAIYVQYSSSLDRSLIALFGLTLVLVTVLILWLENRSRGKSRYYRLGAGAARRKTVALGRWKYPSVALLSLLAMVSLGLPVANVLYWTLRGTSSEHLDILDLAQRAFNSVAVSSLAAAAAVGVAIPITTLTTRRKSAFNTFIEAASYSGYALPGIVLALSLVFFAANYASFIYQSLLLLIIAYVLHFIPAAIGSIRTSWLQLNPHLPESAHTLGHGSTSVFTRISMPLLRPGIAAAAALVFLSVMKELPATLLLGPTGFSTLATSIWAFTDEAMFAPAGPPALLLLALASLPMYFLLPRLGSQ